MTTEPDSSNSSDAAYGSPCARPPKSLPYQYAQRHGVLLKHCTADHCLIAHRPALQPEVIAELRRCLGKSLRFERLDDERFTQLLSESYEQGSHKATQVMEDLGEDLNLTHVASALSRPADLLDSDDDAPIIRLINALLTEAVKDNASDIHIEPYERKLVVRFRIDGVLQEMLQPPYQLAPLLVSRIKVMAQLDIAEKRIPQDGRISLRVAGRPVDIRVSTLPSNHGERVVLRLLDNKAGRLNLDQLGMHARHRRLITGMIQKPHGLLLVTGPTGSGKTTTLYAALTQLNDHSRNIVTVEDPIEYYLDGISQTQVNTKIDLTFARGLRAILRQDPDVVMIGEIRDFETAQIAIQASLTGHLVLSTVHTNTAISAVTRLRDMGIEPFLLSSSLLGTVAQRLVRLLCPHCKQAYTASASDCQVLELDPAAPPTLYRPGGCEHCRQLGYSGRSGVYEIITIDDTLRSMIHDQCSEQQMLQHARQTAPGIREDAIARVLDGSTSLDEILRVTLDG